MITITVDSDNVTIHRGMSTPTAVYESGAFDDMILSRGMFTGIRGAIPSIKIVRSLTGASLKETKDAYDTRKAMLDAGVVKRDADLRALREKLTGDDRPAPTYSF